MQYKVALQAKFTIMIITILIIMMIIIIDLDLACSESGKCLAKIKSDEQVSEGTLSREKWEDNKFVERVWENANRSRHKISLMKDIRKTKARDHRLTKKSLLFAYGEMTGTSIYIRWYMWCMKRYRVLYNNWLNLFLSILSNLLNNDTISFKRNRAIKLRI